MITILERGWETAGGPASRARRTLTPNKGAASRNNTMEGWRPLF